MSDIARIPARRRRTRDTEARPGGGGMLNADGTPKVSHHEQARRMHGARAARLDRARNQREARRQRRRAG